MNEQSEVYAVIRMGPSGNNVLSARYDSIQEAEDWANEFNMEAREGVEYVVGALTKIV